MVFQPWSSLSSSISQRWWWCCLCASHKWRITRTLKVLQNHSEMILHMVTWEFQTKTSLVLALCPLHSSVLYRCVFKQIHMLIWVSYFLKEGEVLCSPLGYLLIATWRTCYSTRNLISLFFTFETHPLFLSLSPKRLEFYIANENSPCEFKSSKIRDAQNGRGLVWAAPTPCITDRKTDSHHERPIRHHPGN